MKDSLEIETMLKDKGLNAPRVSMVEVEAAVDSEFYFTAADGVSFNMDAPRPMPSAPTPSRLSSLSLLTFCVLVLKNGFTVTGESACASPANFNAEIGRKVARQNALDKIWPLLGYELKTKLSKS